MELQALHKSKLNFEEKKAIDAIKKNPKFFYAYAKKHSKIKPKIGPLKRSDGTFTTDQQEIAELLSKQYCSVFSKPVQCNEENVLDPAMENILEDFEFDEDDVIAAITELSSTAAAGPDRLCAKLILECKSSISSALVILWRKSLDTSIIPRETKDALICPIHKGGSFSIPANYRPVALTSHLL